jgi:Ca2+-dependent lipid-binding protein
LNPNFSKSIVVDYVFEVKQEIRFEVRDDDGSSSELIGTAQTTLGTLVVRRVEKWQVTLREPKTRPPFWTSISRRTLNRKAS